MGNYKTKIDFEFPRDDLTIIDVVYEILEKHNLGYYQKDSSKWPQKGDESYAMIIIDTVSIVLKKIISEEKIVELLEKHLKISEVKAKEVLSDIKIKIIPYAKEVSVDDHKKGIGKVSAQEFILEKIKKNAPIQQASFSQPSNEKIKKIEIKSVEDNAENLKNKNERGQDVYREKIE